MVRTFLEGQLQLSTAVELLLVLDREREISLPPLSEDPGASDELVVYFPNVSYHFQLIP